MNTRNLIRTELNGLLAVTAETYNDLIPADITEADLDTIADTIEAARQVTEDNLIGVTQELVKETTALVQQAQVKKEARVSRLLPKDIGLTGVVSAVPAPVTSEIPIAPVIPRTTPTLEGPQAGLPREVANTELLAPMATGQLQEATERALANVGGGGGAAGVVDMDYGDEGYNHDLGLTVDQQNRLKAGIPINTNKNAPPKAFGHYEKAPVTGAAAAPSTTHASALRQIGKLAAKYASASDPAMSMLATSIVTIAEEALNENFS